MIIAKAFKNTPQMNEVNNTLFHFYLTGFKICVSNNVF